MTQLGISGLRNWSAPVAATDTAASVSIGRRSLNRDPGSRSRANIRFGRPAP